jgi:predicted alpha-1,6-mannanase (GH76 family)
MFRRTVGISLALSTFTLIAQQPGLGTPPQARVALGLSALQRHYDAERGLWDTEGWWNAANTITVIGEASSVEPSTNNVDLLENTFVKAQRHFVEFRNEYYDDEGWWALAWIQAYDVTRDQKYLDMAESIFSDMASGWDDTCRGGIWWKKDRKYKNAIANELFLSVGAHLAARESAQKRMNYLAWTKREWDWFDKSGMINADNLVNDGLTADCKNNGQNTWSYNQGVIVGGLVEFSRVSHNPSLVRNAQTIARAAISNLTDSVGILHDRTEPKCSTDTVQFKGIFVRNLLALQSAIPNEEYARFIRNNANSIWNSARTKDNDFACRWSGPPADDGAAALTSALDALTAAATLH